MLRLEPFKPEHIEHIIGREDVEQSWIGSNPSALAQQHWEEGHPAWTAYDDDTILGCGGIAILWKGVALSWMWLNPELVEKRPLWFHKTVKAKLQELIIEHNLRRIQCTVDEGFVMGNKWIKLLGFKEEGRMRKYGPNGETYILYALITEG